MSQIVVVVEVPEGAKEILVRVEGSNHDGCYVHDSSIDEVLTDSRPGFGVWVPAERQVSYEL